MIDDNTSWSDWPFNYGSAQPEVPRLTAEQMAAFDQAAREAAEYVRATANMSDEDAARYRGTLGEGANQSPIESHWGFRFGFAQAAREKDYGI